MRFTRSRSVALLAALAVLGAAPAASEGTSPATAVTAKACKKGKINGVKKRLCRGQFCQRGAKRQYPKYGFKCNKRDRNGRWHLR